MHVELTDWSIDGNITMEMTIPVLIESCLTTGLNL